jgi:hypothetical protein
MCLCLLSVLYVWFRCVCLRSLYYAQCLRIVTRWWVCVAHFVCCLCCRFDVALFVFVLCIMPNVTCVYELSHADVSVLPILFVVCVVCLTLLCLSSVFVLCPMLPVSTTCHTLMCLCCSFCLLSVLYVWFRFVCLRSLYYVQCYLCLRLVTCWCVCVGHLVCCLRCNFDFALFVFVLCIMPNLTCVYELSHADVSVLLILFVFCGVSLILLCLSSFFALCPMLPVSTTCHTLMRCVAHRVCCLCCMFDFALLVCVLCIMPNVTCVYELSHADVSVLPILFVVCVVCLTLLCLSSFFVLCPMLPVCTNCPF